MTVRVRPRTAERAVSEFDVRVRLDTPQEVVYYAHGGVLPYVYRRFLGGDIV